MPRRRSLRASVDGFTQLLHAREDGRELRRTGLGPDGQAAGRALSSPFQGHPRGSRRGTAPPAFHLHQPAHQMSLANKVFLADELVQGSRTHPLGQGRIGGRRPRPRRPEGRRGSSSRPWPWSGPQAGVTAGSGDCAYTLPHRSEFREPYALGSRARYGGRHHDTSILHPSQLPMEIAEPEPRYLRIARIVILCLGVWMVVTTSAILVLALTLGQAGVPRGHLHGERPGLLLERSGRLPDVLRPGPGPSLRAVPCPAGGPSSSSRSAPCWPWPRRPSRRR